MIMSQEVENGILGIITNKQEYNFIQIVDVDTVKQVSCSSNDLAFNTNYSFESIKHFDKERQSFECILVASDSY